MMRPIILKAAMFRDHGEDPEEHIRSRLSMLYLLEWLVMHDRLWLRMYPDTPKIYDSDVQYIYKDSIEAPAWQDISVCLAKKTGDCKDFAAWRVAELREEGVDCSPVIQWRKVGDAYRFHALVKYPDGTLEDPSRLLGMNADTNFITPPGEDNAPDSAAKDEVPRDGFHSVTYNEDSPEEGDNEMNAAKIADAVVRGLCLGDDLTKKRAKETYAKLTEMMGSDPDSARAVSTIKRACAYVRSGIDRGEEDVQGLVSSALNPSKRKSILVPENVRGIGVYAHSRNPIDNLLGLDDTGTPATTTPDPNAAQKKRDADVSTPLSALVSLIPGIGLLAPLTPLAVKGADDLITQAQNGDKKAVGKIADTKAKAGQGDAVAKADLDALQRVKKAKDATLKAIVEALAPKSWWPKDLYNAGIGPTIN